MIFYILILLSDKQICYIIFYNINSIVWYFVVSARTNKRSSSSSSKNLPRLLEISDSRAGILLDDISFILEGLEGMSILFCEISVLCSWVVVKYEVVMIMIPFLCSLQKQQCGYLFFSVLNIIK
jgi:hypothetical protein